MLYLKQKAQKESFKKYHTSKKFIYPKSTVDIVYQENGKYNIDTVGDILILSNNFLNKYKKTPKFGFGDMSEFVFKNKYARIKADGKKEEFWEVIQRNVEGIFRLLDKYADHTMYQSMKKDIAEEMYDHMYNLRFLPAGSQEGSVL